MVKYILFCVHLSEGSFWAAQCLFFFHILNSCRNNNPQLKMLQNWTLQLCSSIYIPYCLCPFGTYTINHNSDLPTTSYSDDIVQSTRAHSQQASKSNSRFSGNVRQHVHLSGLCWMTPYRTMYRARQHLENRPKSVLFPAFSDGVPYQ